MVPATTTDQLSLLSMLATLALKVNMHRFLPNQYEVFPPPAASTAVRQTRKRSINFEEALVDNAAAALAAAEINPKATAAKTKVTQFSTSTDATGGVKVYVKTTRAIVNPGGKSILSDQVHRVPG